MKKIAFIILAATSVAAIPHHTYAWGKKGHNMVAEIAFSILDSNTQKNVQKYLGSTTIEEASTWMDDVRSDHSYDYMKPWHYVNIAKGGQYSPAKEGDIISALTNAIDSLNNKSKLSDASIKTNLLILFHLTGDLHQPLHVGYADDKGGNTIKVKFIDHSNANLHWVWDSEIIDYENISLDDCLGMYKEWKKKDIAKYQEINVLEWSKEPRSLLDNVYDFKDNTIDKAYADRNKEVIEKQLVIAGIRLAAVLQSAFKS